MAITPLRETIMAYIKATTLPLINGAGNYNLSAGKITRDYTLPFEATKDNFPYLQVIDDQGVDYTLMTAAEIITGNDITSLDDGHRIAVVGYVKHSDPETLVTNMNLLWSDILIAMSSDDTLGGNVSYCALISDKLTLTYVSKIL